MVKSPSSNARDMGSIPGWGANAIGHCYRATRPMLHNKSMTQQTPRAAF